MDILNQRLDNYFKAVRENDTQNLQTEITKNPDLINEAENLFGFTPLMLASRLGHAEVAGVLINQIKENKQSLDKTNKLGQSALFLAASNGRVELAKTLVNAGANKELKDNLGRSAQSIASQNRFQL